MLDQFPTDQWGKPGDGVGDRNAVFHPAQRRSHETWRSSSRRKCKQRAADLGALSDLCTPWCVHVVATLRIAEHLEAGKDQIGDLAAAAGCDAETLHRLLTYLVGKGVFEEPTPGRFALNKTARGLLSPASHIGLDLDGIGGRMAYAWGTLLTYVRTGAPGYHQVFGKPFWEDLEAHPEVAASFDALIGPTGHGMPRVDFEITGGWESVRNVVDVGGGTGALLAALRNAGPRCAGRLLSCRGPWHVPARSSRPPA